MSEKIKGLIPEEKVIQKKIENESGKVKNTKVETPSTITPNTDTLPDKAKKEAKMIAALQEEIANTPPAIPPTVEDSDIPYNDPTFKPTNLHSPSENLGKQTTNWGKVVEGAKIFSIAAITSLLPFFANAQKHSKNTEKLLTQKLESIKKVIDAINNAKLEGDQKFVEVVVGQKIEGVTVGGIAKIESKDSTQEVFLVKFDGYTPDMLKREIAALKAMGLNPAGEGVLEQVDSAVVKRYQRLLSIQNTYQEAEDLGQYKNKQVRTNLVATSRRTQGMNAVELDMLGDSIINYFIIASRPKAKGTTAQYADGLAGNK